jgi:hypothetical protein
MANKSLQDVADQLLKVIIERQIKVEPGSTGNGIRVDGIEIIRQPSSPTITRGATL